MNTLDLFRLEGKTAIVTGGGRGLGRYMAEALSDAGANVALCSRKIEPLEEVREEIEARGGKAHAVECDVTDPEDVEKVVRETEEAFGDVDILVNNSGATWGAPAAEMPLEKFDQVVRVNVRGTFLMSQAVGRRMIERGTGGTIINISSIAGILGGDPDYMQTVGYNTSKGAIISMTRDLATAWAPHGITVNAIAPGWFPTRMSGRPHRELRGEDAFRYPVASLRRSGGPQRRGGLSFFVRRFLHHRPNPRRRWGRHGLVVCGSSTEFV